MTSRLGPIGREQSGMASILTTTEEYTYPNTHAGHMEFLDSVENEIESEYIIGYLNKFKSRMTMSDDGYLDTILLSVSKGTQLDVVDFILKDGELKPYIKSSNLAESLKHISLNIPHTYDDECPCDACEIVRLILNDDDVLRSRIEEIDLSSLLFSASKRQEWNIVWPFLKSEVFKNKIKGRDIACLLRHSTKNSEDKKFDVVLHVLRDDILKNKITNLVDFFENIIRSISHLDRACGCDACETVWHILKDPSFENNREGFIGVVLQIVGETGQLEIAFQILTNDEGETVINERDWVSILRGAYYKPDVCY